MGCHSGTDAASSTRTLNEELKTDFKNANNMSDTKIQEVAQKLAEDFMKKYDKNNDGTLDFKEYKPMIK